jgi:hypothetical protein
VKRLVIALVLGALAACGGSKSKPPLEPSNDALPSDDGGAAAASDSDAGTTTSETGPDGGPLDPLPAPPVAAAPVEQKGDEEGAQTFLKQFVAPNADHAALTKSLRPTTADYKAMFDGPTATKVEAGQAKDWAKAVIRPKPGQNDVKMWSATGAELAAGKGNAKEFPTEYKKFGKHLVPTLTYWKFKFVETGKEAGTAYDGLAFVNGHWAIAPKPWRALEKNATSDDDDKPKPKKKRKK